MPITVVTSPTVTVGGEPSVSDRATLVSGTARGFSVVADFYEAAPARPRRVVATLK